MLGSKRDEYLRRQTKKAVGATDVGVIKMRLLDIISQHLIASNNASIGTRPRILHDTTLPNSLKGGRPTCIAVNTKFIAVGMQRGIILLFDHFEQIKMVLNR